MPSATMRRSRGRTSDKNAVRISMARTLSASTGRTLPTVEAKPILPRADRTIASLVPADDEMRKPEGPLGPARDRLGRVLRGRKAFLWIEGPRLGHHVGESPRDARHEISRGSIEFRLPRRELFHRGLRVLCGQEEKKHRADAVQVAGRSGFSEVLLRGPPAGRVDDGPRSRELMELLLRRSEVDQDDLPVGVEDDVLGLHVPMDDVPTMKIGQGLEQLEDVSSRGGRIGRLVPVALPEGLAFELLLDETERPEVGALVQISYDPRMTGGAQGPQDLGLNPK